jgi:2,4-dienoyl-CoA reductase-like NADH-dependent reductase (Old Yellow Enzyme family)/NAD(P)-dependent dehydrogenase (short-subunit alcohol dehydrogenase family)
MSNATYPNLFSPITIRGKRLKNRIVSTGHDTCLPTDDLVNDELVAYHEARARGGCSLIVLQVSGVHETARYTSHLLMANDDQCIDGYRRLADMCRNYDTRIFGQLFHPGREIMETAEGIQPVAYSASAVPSERFHQMPRAMNLELISEVVQGYADAAGRMQEAGLDGVEIVASHGYLPAQFLSPRVNLRQDQYGRDKLLFLTEVLDAVRQKTGADFIIGLRLSESERDPSGLQGDESLQAALALESRLDYISITAGTSNTLGGAIHIAPPMTTEHAYLAPASTRFKQKLNIPVIVAGRINQPQEAERIIASEQADLCGMTRALICDPNMPTKAKHGKNDSIRACIGCNQACIGHFHKGLPISCIQHPATGRELKYSNYQAAAKSKHVMIIGGGPAGMKAAQTAARRGHKVTLLEASPRLGGQALLAQLIPARAEFGGLVTNLEQELRGLNIDIRLNAPVDKSLVQGETPDVIILATGAKPYWPEFERDGSMQVVDAWQILQDEVKVGKNVVVSDWRSDWIGMGVAEKLALQGCNVTLAVNGLHAGEMLQSYVRDSTAGRLHNLDVKILPYARLFGCDDDTVYLQHSVTDAAMVLEHIDTLVLSHGHQPVDSLIDELEGIAPIYSIGDCLAPRTSEEAVLDGLRVGFKL